MDAPRARRLAAPPPNGAGRRRLIRLLWLSAAAAVATIALKATAWLLTGSVGLLADAAESLVNVVAALVAIGAVSWATKPADEEHAYGHAKAEYFSAGAEGALIMLAAVTIAVVSVERLLHPRALEDVGLGLAVSAAASAINLGVGLALMRSGRRERSIALEADGRHLLADVWTSAGVIAGVAGAALTGWRRLDALIALAVALYIVVTGSGLVRRSAGGLMDRSLGEDERRRITEVLARFEEEGIRFHAVRSRQAGSRAFISLHVLVPGAWTVQRGHDVAEDVEAALRERIPYATVFTHLEPEEDPRSFADTALDRAEADPAPPG
jgi:cation diffusion facilitator family transporter